jgi:hypothetical protein
MSLLTIPGVARGSSGCTANGSPDQRASTGVAVPNIIADDCARYSAQGSPGKGASLSVRASGTTCEDERNSGGKTGEKLGFHGEVGFFLSGILMTFSQGGNGKYQVSMPWDAEIAVLFKISRINLGP